VATCALYGWLESSVNMIEGLRQLFQPDAGTVIFSPILLLFITLCLVVFIGVSQISGGIAAVLGGLLLRSRSVIVSQSFLRSFAYGAVICQFVFTLFAVEQNARFLHGRPRVHPTAPSYVLASLVAANAALTWFVAAFIIRKLIGKAEQHV